MKPITFYRTDGKRMHRYYRLDVQPNLFGEWCFMREWGRASAATGACAPCRSPTLQEAYAALDKRRKAKERRGYSV